MIDTAMTFREMTLRAYRREPLPHVLFQPRFEPWFAWHEQFDTLPEPCRGKTIHEVYEDVGCSMRYQHYYTGQPSPVTNTFDASVKIERHRTDDQELIRYHTPHGELTEELEFTVDRTWRTVVFPGKSAEDLPALTWLLERQQIAFDPEAYRAGDDFVGDLGVGQFWLTKSPYMALAQQWMRFEAFLFALADVPDQIEELLEVIDRSYDTVYQQICDAKITPIINFGENIAEAYMSPTYFREYLLPWYAKRVGQLRDAGIYSHIHIDGYFKSLLPWLNDLPHDGLEALTPLPQGDVTLEQIAEHTGDKILLDLIPAVLFLDHHPREELQACVERIVDLFGPRLILGISDELPQGGNDESFDRLQWVADYAKSCSSVAAQK